MERVRELHGQLSGVVHHLNDKVRVVLQKQESEFLSAYRGHMYTVQKELQEWKDKADAMRLQQERDSRMERLREECEWFRKEALRLNKFTNALKRDVQLLRDQLSVVEEDRDWLHRQLKTTKKDNKLLRAEIQMHREVGGDRGSQEGSRSSLARGSLENGRGSHGDSDLRIASHHRSGITRLTAEVEEAEETDREEPGEASFLPKLAQSHAGRSRNDRNSSGDQRVARLERRLHLERNRVRQLKAARMEQDERKSELESFFLACVEDVRRGAEKKRGGQGVRGGPLPLSSLDRSERREIIVRLLDDDFVLGKLYELVFGNPAGGGAREKEAGKAPPSPLRRRGRGRGGGLRKGVTHSRTSSLQGSSP